MPVQISMSMKNGNLWISNLERLKLWTQRMPSDVVRPEMEQAERETETYPAERTGQTYTRTYRMADSTRLEAQRGNNQHSVSYTLKVGVPHAKYPLGDARGQGQAWMHKENNRWTPMYQRVLAAQERIRLAVGQWLERFGT